MRPTAKLIVFSFLVLAGCARFHPEPLSLSKGLEEFQGRNLNDSGLQSFMEAAFHHKVETWPLQSWDLDLLTLTALYYHPDFDLAKAQWKISQGSVVTAGERPNPTMGFLPEYKVSPSNISPWLYGFTFDIPVETMGKRGKRISQARHHAQSTYLNLAVTAWQIRGRVRNAYIQHQLAKRRNEIFQQEVALQKEYFEFLDSGQGASSVSLPDRLQTQLSLYQNQLALSDSEKQVGETKIILAESIGVPVATLNEIKFETAFPTRANLTPDQIREVALAKRPDLLASLEEYEASQSALQLEIAKQYPDIHIGPGYTWDQGVNKWSAGITITLPLLNHNQGPVREAKARREEARVKLLGLQEKVIFEVERTLHSYQAALSKLQTAHDLLSNAQHQHHLVDKMLKTGTAGQLTRLNSELALKSSELAFSDAQFNFDTALGILEDSVMFPVASENFHMDTFIQEKVKVNESVKKK